MAKIQLSHAFLAPQPSVCFIGHGVAQAVGGGVEVGKQAFDVWLGWVAVGRGFDGFKDIGEVGVQAVVAVGTGGHIHKKLAWKMK